MRALLNGPPPCPAATSSAALRKGRYAELGVAVVWFAIWPGQASAGVHYLGSFRRPAGVVRVGGVWLDYLDQWCWTYGFVYSACDNVDGGGLADTCVAHLGAAPSLDGGRNDLRSDAHVMKVWLNACWLCFRGARPAHAGRAPGGSVGALQPPVKEARHLTARHGLAGAERSVVEPGGDLRLCHRIDRRLVRGAGRVGETGRS